MTTRISLAILLAGTDDDIAAVRRANKEEK